MEELAHHPNRGVWLTFEPGRAPNIDRAIKVEVVDIVVELAHKQSRDGLVADSQHLRARAQGSYVLVTPPDFVIEAQAGNGSAVGVELHAFGARRVVAQVLRERHFHSGN